jgi:hypothetical protein
MCDDYGRDSCALTLDLLASTTGFICHWIRQTTNNQWRRNHAGMRRSGYRRILFAFVPASRGDKQNKTNVLRENIGILVWLLMICNKQRLGGWWFRSWDQRENTIFAHENSTTSSDGYREWPTFTWVELEHSNQSKSLKLHRSFVHFNIIIIISIDKFKTGICAITMHDNSSTN